MYAINLRVKTMEHVQVILFQNVVKSLANVSQNSWGIDVIDLKTLAEE